MKKTITCGECGKRDRCRALCPGMDRLIRSEERHFQGREILVGPRTINTLFSNRRTATLADLISEPVRAAEVRVIPGLTDRQLRILTLSLVRGKSHRAIANALGINQSTVGEHIMAARRKARRYLEESLRGERHAACPAREKKAGNS